MSVPTISERIFENYIASHGVEFERIPENGVPRPDYRVRIRAGPLIVEVKEFNRRLNEGHEADTDPAVLIREKIKGARRKFDLYRDCECCLVLYNRGKTGLLHPQQLLRAMFGEHVEPVGMNAYRFSGLAELRPHQNTRLSAVVALLPVPGYTSMLRHVDPSISAPGVIATRESMRQGGPDSDTVVVRAAVVENPFARRPLSREAFDGPFDERWARVDDGTFRLVSSGTSLAAMRAVLPEQTLKLMGF
ncbi:MAG: hypothetical protein M1570_02250 [Chloroflexi bacterium]|nr:hypothetical protein [Chloroflexota bacterium]